MFTFKEMIELKEKRKCETIKMLKENILRWINSSILYFEWLQWARLLRNHLSKQVNSLVKFGLQYFNISNKIVNHEIILILILICIFNSYIFINYVHN